MESTISNAVVLLLIGMITVTIVLSLVVLTGKIVIRLANKYAPAPVIENKSLPFRKKSGTSPKVVAILTGVVSHVTGGQGQITSITKSKS